MDKYQTNKCQTDKCDYVESCAYHYDSYNDKGPPCKNGMCNLKECCIAYDYAYCMNKLRTLNGKGMCRGKNPPPCKKD